MNWSDIPARLLVDAQMRFWNKLGDRADTVALWMSSDSQYIASLAQFAITSIPIEALDEPDTLCTESEAREIMGNNFFGIADAIRCFKITPTTDEVEKLATIPFDCQTLKGRATTHFLVAVFPIPIARMMKQVTNVPVRYNSQLVDTINPQDNPIESPSWHLVSKTPVALSMGKFDPSIQRFFQKNEKVPRAHVLLYMTLGNISMRNEWLFKSIHLHCAESIPSEKEVVLTVNYSFRDCSVEVREYSDLKKFTQIFLVTEICT